MQKHSETIKTALSAIIANMAESSMLYAKDPERDFTRTRKLPFDAMLKHLICMGGNTLTKELLDSYGYDPDIATSSAFVQQRDKILPSAFEFLLNEFTSSCAAIKRYKGYRLFANDGSSLNIAHDPNDTDTFFQNKLDRKGFNLMHLNALYDLCSRIYIDAIVQPGRRENENKALVDMIDRSPIQDKVIVVADRGFEAYNNIAHIERKGWNYVIRIKDIASSRGILSGLDLPKAGEFDVPVSFILTRKQTNEIKARPDIYKFVTKKSPFDFLDLHENKFYPISFRIVRVFLPNGEYESLITNLNAEAFSPGEIKEIYRRRWGIETSFRALKYTIGLFNFHAKKRGFILQEIFARLIMYNFVEIITSHVVISVANRKHEYRVNFTVAVCVCRRFLRHRANEPPLDADALIKKHIVPVRPREGLSGERKPRVKSSISFTYRIA